MIFFGREAIAYLTPKSGRLTHRAPELPQTESTIGLFVVKLVLPLSISGKHVQIGSKLGKNFRLKKLKLKF